MGIGVRGCSPGDISLLLGFYCGSLMASLMMTLDLEAYRKYFRSRVPKIKMCPMVIQVEDAGQVMACMS